MFIGREMEQGEFALEFCMVRIDSTRGLDIASLTALAIGKEKGEALDGLHNIVCSFVVTILLVRRSYMELEH
jgi:hypothetical protein